MGQRQGRKLENIAAIDGLRAIAVVMVMLHHAVQPNTWFDGGRGGVDVFLVISGFLITSLLVNEFDRTDRVSLPKFYRRRAYRLLPASIVMLGVTVAYATVTSVASGFGVPRPPFKAALFALVYASNWAWAFGANLPGYFIHLWTLAAEEQFYLVAPIALAVMLPRMSRRSVVITIGVVGVVLVAWRGFLFANDTDLYRIRFGLDTHADGILIGSMLGVAFASGLGTRIFAADDAKRGLGVASIIALVLITVVDQHDWAGVEFWLPLVYGLAGLAAVVSVIGQPDGLHIQVLTNNVMRRIGKVSYALYLWHLPVMYFSYRALGDGVPLLIKVIIGSALSYVAAELSWRLVEAPAQRIRDARANRRQEVRT